MSDSVTYSSREEIEVHRFSPVATIGIPLAALLIQVLLGTRFRFIGIFDLPLLVTIFFAVARRSQVSGLLTGMIIGIVQDALTTNPIGLFGISKTVVGYAASSLGVKLDVDNPGSRILMGFFFYLLHQGVYYMVDHWMLGRALDWSILHILGAGVANGLLAVILFAGLDKFKQRA